MPIDVDVYTEIIYITSPTTNVTIQEIYDATRAVEDSTVGINFDDIIILGEGKTDVGGGFLNPATMKLNPRWYIEFWDGVLLGTVAGGNITGGLDNRPVRATVGSGDTALVLGAERGIISTDAGAITGQIADAVWNADEAKRMLGLSHENVTIDQPVYDTDGNLTSARVRLYSDAASVGSDLNVIAEYNIAAPSTGPGIFTTWSQKKV